MSMAFLSVSRPTFSVSFVMSGPPCLGLGAGPSGATPVIACARTAHLNPLPWTCGLSLSKDAGWSRSHTAHDDLRHRPPHPVPGQAPGPRPAFGPACGAASPEEARLADAAAPPRAR